MAHVVDGFSNEISEHETNLAKLWQIGKNRDNRFFTKGCAPNYMLMLWVRKRLFPVLDGV
jgi:hypothetical protein